jgi:signal transduction histidine kinase
MYKKLIRSEKLANIGEMASMLAHEIKNPLAIIRSSAQYLVSEPRDQQTRQELLEYIVDEVDTLNLVFSNILGLSGYKNPKFAELDLTGTLDKIIDRWESGYDHNPRVTIVRQYPKEPLLMIGDKKQLSQMFINLIRNGEEAIPGNGTLFVEIHQNINNDTLKIIIRDTGTGIAPENTTHVFRKFFTTKEKGLGLGLPLCRQIIQAHKGTLDLFNNPDRGAAMVIKLPRQLVPDMQHHDTLGDFEKKAGWEQL